MNVAPSLISLAGSASQIVLHEVHSSSVVHAVNMSPGAGAVVNVAPGKACGVKVDPNLIKVTRGSHHCARALCVLH